MIEIFEKLTIFNDYKFYEDEHVYTYKGKKVSLSATKLIEEYSQPFDKDKWATLCAKRKKITIKQMLEIWEVNNQVSQVKGTHLHRYMEDGLANKAFIYPYALVVKQFGYDFFADEISEKTGEVIDGIWSKITKMMNSFLSIIRNRLIPIRSELIIGCPEYDIAGAIDQLFFNKKTGELEIWDWKTNKEIKSKSFKGQKMKGILSHLDDCNFIHYSLQLYIYKHIIQKMTGLKIGACRIVWFNEKNDSYKVITCKDLHKEAEQILEMRKIND